MNKRILAALAALMMIAAAGCGNKKKESSESSAEQPTTAAAETTTEAAAATTSATTKKSAKTTASSTKSKKTEETTKTTAAPFADPSVTDDEMLIASAQRYYEIACETMWNFTVGCPYEIDLSKHIENQYGWQFYLVTTEGINSVEDVKADYHQFFSDKYPDELDQLYMEQDGRVYALSAGRGKNIFYESSEVTGIESRENGEVFFTVVNHMSGNDFGEGAYDETTTFSLITEDQVMKVGKFRLPY